MTITLFLQTWYTFFIDHFFTVQLQVVRGFYQFPDKPGPATGVFPSLPPPPPPVRAFIFYRAQGPAFPFSSFFVLVDFRRIVRNTRRPCGLFINRSGDGEVSCRTHLQPPATMIEESMEHFETILSEWRGSLINPNLTLNRRNSRCSCLAIHVLLLCLLLIGRGFLFIGLTFQFTLFLFFYGALQVRSLRGKIKKVYLFFAVACTRVPFTVACARNDLVYRLTFQFTLSLFLWSSSSTEPERKNKKCTFFLP